MIDFVLDLLVRIPAMEGAPLWAALVLAGIHVYLGIHVIGRKVIFVDLGLAQIAALGAAFGVLMGYEAQHSAWGLFGYSLAFTVLAALVFSVTKAKSEAIPHEAIIGITYAVAVAVTMLVLSKSPLGPQEFDRMLKGELLYVSDAKVQITALIYGGVGLLHWLLRRQFLVRSFGGGQKVPAPSRWEAAAFGAVGLFAFWIAGKLGAGLPVRALLALAAVSSYAIRPWIFALGFDKAGELRWPFVWDFLFYASFGLVVTSSVAIVGVFLVFCLLVIPAVGALLFAERMWVRLAIGWVAAGFLCLRGIAFAFQRNLQFSPMIVVFLAAALVVAAVVRFVVRAESKPRALARIGAFAAFLAIFGAGVWHFRNRGEDPFEKAIHLAHSQEETQRLMAVSTFEAYPQRKAEWLQHALTLLEDPSAVVRERTMRVLVGMKEALPEVARLLRDREDHVREQCADLLHEYGPGAVPHLLSAGDAEESLDLRVHMYVEALEFGSKEAVDRLLKVLEDPDLPKRRREHAYKNLAPHVDVEFRPDEIPALRAWWTANRDRAVWLETGGSYKFTVK
jgi:zinc/manganese transport system permease protein